MSLRTKGLLGSGTLRRKPGASQDLKAQAPPQPGGLWTAPSSPNPTWGQPKPQQDPHVSGSDSMLLLMAPRVPGFGQLVIMLTADLNF